jgi:hypothetical protein
MNIVERAWKESSMWESRQARRDKKRREGLMKISKVCIINVLVDIMHKEDFNREATTIIEEMAQKLRVPLIPKEV